MFGGNREISGLYQQSLASRIRPPRRPLSQSNPPTLRHTGRTENNHGSRSLAPTTSSRQRRGTAAQRPIRSPENRVSKSQKYSVRHPAMSPSYRLTVRETGSVAAGCPLKTFWNSGQSETLISWAAASKLGLTDYPWKPGPPVSIVIGHCRIEVRRYVMVHVEAPWFGKVLGDYNFGILPDDIEILGNPEIIVGLKLMDRLEDCGFPKDNYAAIDMNKQQRQLPRAASQAIVEESGAESGPAPQTPAHLPPTPCTYLEANTTTGFTSLHSSTGVKTSVSDSSHVQQQVQDCTNHLIQQDLDGDGLMGLEAQNEDEDMFPAGSQVSKYDMDYDLHNAQAYDLSQPALRDGFNLQETPALGLHMASTVSEQRHLEGFHLQVPSLTIHSGRTPLGVSSSYSQPASSSQYGSTPLAPSLPASHAGSRRPSSTYQDFGSSAGNSPQPPTQTQLIAQRSPSTVPVINLDSTYIDRDHGSVEFPQLDPGFESMGQYMFSNGSEFSPGPEFSPETEFGCDPSIDPRFGPGPN